LKAILKKCDFSVNLKMFTVGAARSSCGREFHAAGLACEKASSPNLVDSQMTNSLWCWQNTVWRDEATGLFLI